MGNDVSVSFGADIGDLTSKIDQVKSALAGLASPVAALGQTFAQMGEKVAAAPFEAASAAVKELQSVTDAAAGHVAQLSSVFSSLNETIAKGGAGTSDNWLKTLLGGGAIVAVGVGVLDFLGKANQEMLDLTVHARQTGLALDKFQEMRFAANESGVGSDKFNSGIDGAAKKLNDLRSDLGDVGKLFDANHIKLKDDNDQIISMASYWLAVSNLIRNAKTEQDKFKIADTTGFGKDLVPALEQGSAELERMQQQAHEAGAVFDNDLVQKGAAMAQAWNRSSLEWSTFLKGQIIQITPFLNDLIGLASKLGQFFSSLQPQINEMKDQQEAFNNIVDRTLTTVGTWLGLNNAVSAASNRVRETFSDMQPEIDAGSSKLEQWRQKIAEFHQSLQGSAATLKDIGGNKTTVIPGDDKDKGNQIQAFQDQIRLADQLYRGQEELIKSQAKVHQITQQEETAQLLAALEARHTAQATALDAELPLLDQSKRQYQSALDEKKRLDQQYANDRQKIMDQAAQQEYQTWKSYADQAAGAINSQLRNLLSGHETFGQAVKNIFADMVIKLIEDVDKWAIEWIANQLRMTVASTTAAAAQTTATTASTAASAAAQSTNTFATIQADAAKVFGGVFAFLAPLMGPAAAAPASASAASVEAVGATAAFPGAAIGGYVLQSGLAEIHAGEQIVPAQLAQPYNGAQQGGSGANVTLNLSAFNPQGLQALINQMMPQLAKSLNSYRGLNPSMA